jgi:hypothetical protein
MNIRDLLPERDREQVLADLRQRSRAGCGGRNQNAVKTKSHVSATTEALSSTSPFLTAF